MKLQEDRPLYKPVIGYSIDGAVEKSLDVNYFYGGDNGTETDISELKTRADNVARYLGKLTTMLHASGLLTNVNVLELLDGRFTEIEENTNA